jgi:hypothetical protein
VTTDVWTGKSEFKSHRCGKSIGQNVFDVKAFVVIESQACPDQVFFYIYWTSEWLTDCVYTYCQVSEPRLTVAGTCCLVAMTEPEERVSEEDSLYGASGMEPSSDGQACIGAEVPAELLVPSPRTPSPGRIARTRRLYKWYRNLDQQQVMHLGLENATYCFDRLAGCKLRDILGDVECCDLLLALHTQYLSFTGRAIPTHRL